jgi:hypothetical protein
VWYGLLARHLWVPERPQKQASKEELSGKLTVKQSIALPNKIIISFTDFEK